MADHEAGAGADYQARGITKTFADIAVLRDVTAHFRPGEIHSLIGENGAGKSTLLKVMAGVYPSDAGTLSLGGQTLPPLTPGDAQRLGIYLVPQEPRLMPDLPVAENLYLGALPTGRIRPARIHQGQLPPVQLLVPPSPTLRRPSRLSPTPATPNAICHLRQRHQ